jgi:hypothetical protein
LFACNILIFPPILKKIQFYGTAFNQDKKHG